MSKEFPMKKPFDVDNRLTEIIFDDNPYKLSKLKTTLRESEMQSLGSPKPIKHPFMRFCN